MGETPIQKMALPQKICGRRKKLLNYSEIFTRMAMK